MSRGKARKARRAAAGPGAARAAGAAGAERAGGPPRGEPAEAEEAPAPDHRGGGADDGRADEDGDPPGDAPGDDGDAPEGDGDEAEGGGEPDEGADAAGPVWTAEDDRTTETLHWLRVMRREHRRKKNRDMAVLVYTITLAAVAYGSTFAYKFLKNLRIGAVEGHTTAAFRDALPAAFTLLVVVVGLAAARDALWRGPVVVPGPAATWLLGQPVDRARVLRPWFRLTAVLALVAGVLCAVAGTVVLHFAGVLPMGSGLAAALPAGVCVPLLAVGTAVRVESRPRVARAVRRWSPAVVVLVLLLAGQAVWAGAGHRIVGLEWVELWSGPWGWAAQPVLHAAGRPVPGWFAAAALLVVLTAGVLVAGVRGAARVPNAQLRARAATAATVASVTWSAELRVAKLAVAEASGGERGRIARLRLPRPRGRRLVVVWRDAMALLRSPARIGKSVLWLAAAAGAAAMGVSLGGEDRVVGVVVALLLGYVGVGALAESARVESDDVRRSAWAPFRYSTLMLLHGVVPTAVAVLLALLAAIPFALHGAVWALLVLPVCAVPFAAAAIFSASRGPVRTDLMFMGIATPMGDPSFIVFVLWFVAAPLVTVGALAVAVNLSLAHGLDQGSVSDTVLTAAALTAVFTWLARRSADKQYRR